MALNSRRKQGDVSRNSEHVCVPSLLPMLESVGLSYLPRIKYFGLPVSFSFLAYGNVNKEECLPLVSVSRVRALRMFTMTFT